jgi:hypothetical protein
LFFCSGKKSSGAASALSEISRLIAKRELKKILARKFAIPFILLGKLRTWQPQK